MLPVGFKILWHSRSLTAQKAEKRGDVFVVTYTGGFDDLEQVQDCRL